MNLPTDNSYIGITTPRFREASDFYVRHFGYSHIADAKGFASVMAPNKKRCLGFSAPDDACPSTAPSGMHLVFLVDDATAALAEFQHGGVPISRGIAVGSWGAKHFVVTDPAGVEIFISERAQQSESQRQATSSSASAPDGRSA
ncbi:MAG: VOC family protein [Nitrospira sp.]|nr:VOC family protein [Nitrospira sp.]